MNHGIILLIDKTVNIKKIEKIEGYGLYNMIRFMQ